MSLQDKQTRLMHMLHAAKKAINFANNRTFQDLEKDELLALALVKLIEIVEVEILSSSDHAVPFPNRSVAILNEIGIP